VEERFFFDRIELDGTDIAVGDEEGSPFIVPDEADPRLSLLDETPVPAGKTADIVSTYFFVEDTLLGVLMEDLIETLCLRYRKCHPPMIKRGMRIVQ